MAFKFHSCSFLNTYIVFYIDFVDNASRKAAHIASDKTGSDDLLDNAPQKAADIANSNVQNVEEVKSSPEHVLKTCYGTVYLYIFTFQIVSNILNIL